VIKQKNNAKLIQAARPSLPGGSRVWPGPRGVQRCEAQGAKQLCARACLLVPTGHVAVARCGEGCDTIAPRSSSYASVMVRRLCACQLLLVCKFFLSIKSPFFFLSFSFSFGSNR